MKYLYTIIALREIDQTTDTEVTASFFHKNGDLTDIGVMRIAKREELIGQNDRLCRVECARYAS
jgi:hypothetical protein